LYTLRDEAKKDIKGTIAKMPGLDIIPLKCLITNNGKFFDLTPEELPPVSNKIIKTPSGHIHAII